MFTGLIEDIGVVKKINYKGKSLEILISSDVITSDIAVGDSVAVNGVCLTVTSYSGDTMCFDLMKESFDRSSFSLLKQGSNVNLERALALGQRLGGHIVTGHVDCSGKLVSVKNEQGSILLNISFPVEYLKFIVEKGSVALDGVSLTVISVIKNILQVGIIPHTGKNTILINKKIGDLINIEFDVFARYVVNCLEQGDKKSSIDWSKIAQEGF